MFDKIKETVSSFKSDAEESVVTTDDSQDSETKSKDAPGLASKAKSLSKGQLVIDDDELEEALSDFEFALLSQDVEVSVVDSILEEIRDTLLGDTRRIGTNVSKPIETVLEESLSNTLSTGQFELLSEIQSNDSPTTIIFTGVNGVGKTTTIAKLSQYFEQNGLSTVMANGDTYRAGAEEQITKHAEALGTKLISHEQGADPTAVIYDAVEYAEANDIDVVLGDTAGRLHNDDSLMNQLEKIHRIVSPEYTIYVDEAVAGQDAVNRVNGFNNAAAIDGVILTKAEADTSGGAALSMAQATGSPVLFLGTGQEYNDIVRFDPDALVTDLVNTTD